MEQSELLSRYFVQLSRLTKNGKITAQEVKDAAAATGDVSSIADAILAHAAAQGIKPEQELADLYAAQSRAKAKAADQQRRAALKTRAATIKALADSLANDAETAAPDKLTEALAAIGKEAAGLVTTSATVNRFPTWADIEKDWQKNTDRDFSPALFDRLGFPEGTVSYIGARTGRGKTTAMVNIGVEALFPTDANTKPRRVLFISLEESRMRIQRRFSLCLAYRQADAQTRAQLDTIRFSDSGKSATHSAYQKWRRGRELDFKEYGQGLKPFIAAITQADGLVKQAWGTSLIFFDGIGAGLSEITAAIRDRNRGDIVLLDYIQKIPGDRSFSSNPDLERIRDGSQALIEAAIGAEAVVIAGAQFNRDSTKGPQRADDTFTDADFRGCGDLEQDGHNLIGIGRGADKHHHYYGIIKSREGEVSDKLIALEFKGGYSYLASLASEYTPPPKGNGRKGKNGASGAADEDDDIHDGYL